MAFQLCRYIRTNGLQCGSPQLHGKPYCYFHNRIALTHTQPPSVDLAIGPTEDRESVQLALSAVISALAADRIDIRRATALLYGLQLASMNAAHLAFAPRASQIVRHTDPDSPTLALPGTLSTEDEDDAMLEHLSLEDKGDNSQPNPQEPRAIPALT